MSNLFKVLGKVKFVKGSILTPHNAGLRFVLSPVNLTGKYAKHPLFPVFEKKWKKVKEDAKGWYSNKTGEYKLGAINTSAVQSDTWVIHMLCQDDEGTTSLSALENCLKKVCASAKYEKASVHVSSLLTASVPELSELLTKYLVNEGVSVSYYEE